MRVAAFIGTADNSGGSRVILTYLAHLKPPRFELCACYCPERSKGVAEHVVAAGARLGLSIRGNEGIDQKLPVQAARQTAAELTTLGTEVLIASNVQNAFRFALFVKLFMPRLRVIAVANNSMTFSGPTWSHPLKKALYRACLRLGTERVVFVSRALQSELWGTGGALPRAPVIENSVDTGLLVGDPGVREQARAEFGLARSSCLVLYSARVTRQKDIATFLEVADAVTRDEPEVHFALAGAAQTEDDHSYAESLGALRTRIRHPDRVHMLGWRTDVRRLLQASDIYLSTARWEGLPLGIVEAMAFARPIVTTAFASASEVVEDGVTGRVHDPGDVEGLARSIRTLVHDPGLRSQMGEQGRQLAQERFDVSRACERFVDVLAEAGAT